MKNKWTNIRGFIIFSLIFMFVLAIDIVIVYAYYRHVRTFLSSQPEDLKADAGIVFFGDYKNHGTLLGPDSEHRAQKAVNLYRQGKIRYIICVGGYDKSYWRGQPNLMREFLLAEGIPDRKIFYDSLSYNTITNWFEARKIIEANHFDTVIAISAPLHILRISRMICTGNVAYASYDYDPAGLMDYWQIYKDTHHEFLSLFLSFALKDNIRNQAVRIYRTVRYEFDRIL